jgi:hypothetical protein
LYAILIEDQEGAESEKRESKNNTAAFVSFMDSIPISVSDELAFQVEWPMNFNLHVAARLVGGQLLIVISGAVSSFL